MSKETINFSFPRLNECKYFIQTHPLFNKLSNELANELASYFRLKIIEPGEDIVQEDALVDAIYFIAEGQAEIKRNFSQLTEMPIAILRKGESIGLSETGFYSQTGKRFATATALSKMVLFELDIAKLNFFLFKYPEVNREMRDTSRLLSLTYFIKQTLPFSPASLDVLFMIAQQIKEVTIPSHKYIFHQDDEAQACYLLLSGELEVLRKEEEQIKRIALLKPPTIFGEAALINNKRRSASIRALASSQILVLNKDIVNQLIACEPSVSVALKQIIAARSTPEMQSSSPQSSKFTQGKLFQLTKEGWLICQ